MAAKRASMSPSDAVSGGTFPGGITRIRKHRFGHGYPEGKSSEIITLRLHHTPKGADEEQVEYLSCGRKASDNFEVGPKGKSLTPKAGAPSIHKSSFAMQYFDSLVAQGFPQDVLGKGDMGLLDGSDRKGLLVKLRQKPVDLPGLSFEGDDTQKKTVLVVAEKGIKAMPKGIDAAAGGDDDDDDDDAGSADDDDDDDTGAAASAADDDDSGSSDDDDDDDDTGASADDDDDDDDTDDDTGVSVKVASKHLVTVLTKLGGKVKRSAISSKAFPILRKETARNDIITTLASEAFLKAQTVATYKKGLITLKK